MIEIMAANDRPHALALGTSGANATTGIDFRLLPWEPFGNEEFANGR
jgi:hypothetical protein